MHALDVLRGPLEVRIGWVLDRDIRDRPFAAAQLRHQAFVEAYTSSRNTSLPLSSTKAVW